MKSKILYFLTGFSIFFVSTSFSFAENSLLSPEENLWLKSRNNTIVVYPEKNFPPFSYQNSSGRDSGLSIDFIDLIAKKIGVKIEYLSARPRSQILEDVKDGKGDVVTSLSHTKDREDILYFTDDYISSPAVIVVRKDYERKVHNLNDFNGRKLAVGDSYAVEDFIRTNFPSVVIDSVTDDESGLQQVVLGEVDGAVIDIASLSYFLSKQVLSSVKVVGNTGYEYKLAFAVPKNKEILQSILEKGLSQISKSDRDILINKWINITDNEIQDSLVVKAQNSFGTTAFYILFLIGLAGIVIFIFRHKNNSFRYFRKSHIRDDLREDLKEEIAELNYANKSIAQELDEIKDLEKDIEDKIKKLD